MGEKTNTWKLNNMLLKNKWVDEKLKRRSKNMLRQMKIKAQFPKTMRPLISIEKMKYNL